MNLEKSTIEDAALEWFEELGYAARHGPHLAPGELAAERDSFGWVMLVGRLRQALHRLVLFSIPFRRLATPRDPLLQKPLNHELSVAVSMDTFYA